MIGAKFFVPALLLLFLLAAGCTGTKSKEQVQPPSTPSLPTSPPVEAPPSYKFEEFLAVKQLILESGEAVDATHVKYSVRYGERLVQNDYRLKAYFPGNSSRAAALGITYLRLEVENPPPVPDELKDKFVEGNLSEGMRAFFFQMRAAIAYPDGKEVEIKKVYVPEKGMVEVEEKIFQREASAIPASDLIKK